MFGWWPNNILNTILLKSFRENKNLEIPLIVLSFYVEKGLSTKQVRSNPGFVEYLGSPLVAFSGPKTPHQGNQAMHK